MVNKKETIKPSLQEAVDVNSGIFKAFVIPSNPIWDSKFEPFIKTLQPSTYPSTLSKSMGQPS
jgi:hypothetical protein